MSFAWTCTSRPALRRTLASTETGSTAAQCPRSSVRPRPGGSPSRRTSVSKSSRRSISIPPSGSSPMATPACAARPRTRSNPSSSSVHALTGSSPGGAVDRPPQQLESPLPALVEQARVIRPAAVEQIAGVRLHDAGEPELLEQPTEALGAGAHARRERVEVHVVERERDALVAGVAQQLQRILDPVLGETARDIGVPEHRPSRL